MSFNEEATPQIVEEQHSSQLSPRKLSLARSLGQLKTLILDDDDPYADPKFWIKRLFFFIYHIVLLLVAAAGTLLGFILPLGNSYGVALKVIITIGGTTCCVFIVLGIIGFLLARGRPFLQKLVVLDVLLNETLSPVVYFFGAYSIIFGLYEMRYLIVDKEDLKEFKFLRHALGQQSPSDYATKIITNRNVFITTGVILIIFATMMIGTPFIAKPIIRKKHFNQSYGISSSLMQLVMAGLLFFHILFYPIFGDIDKDHFSTASTAFLIIHIILAVLQLLGGIFGLLITLSSSLLRLLRSTVRVVQSFFQISFLFLAFSFFIAMIILNSLGKEYRPAMFIEYYFINQYVPNICSDPETAGECAAGIDVSQFQYIVTFFWNIDVINAVIGFSGFIAKSFGDPPPSINPAPSQSSLNEPFSETTVSSPPHSPSPLLSPSIRTQAFVSDFDERSTAELSTDYSTNETEPSS